MRYLSKNPEADFPETFRSLWLNGPVTGVDSCNVLVSRVPAGHKGPRLHTHTVDQFYYVFQGETTVQIGTDVFVVPEHSIVHFPAGVPHCNWNATDGYEMHMELMVPRPPEDNLLTYWEGDVPTIENAADLITSVTPEGIKTGKLLRFHHLAERETGSEHARVYYAEADPGKGGPPLHFHDFDQFYYILEGCLTVQIGHEKFVAERGDLVMLPRGVVHTNVNDGDVMEKHLAILLPEPAVGGQFDYKVTVDYGPEAAFVDHSKEA